MKLQMKALTYALTVVFAGFSGTALASGFALIEQSASGLGNAFAGGAASAEDASTLFFNPAGMSRLSGKQLVVAAHAIKPTAKFADAGTTGAALQTQGGEGGDAGSWAMVPNAYFVSEISPQLRFGLGLNSPFGLQTEYDSSWMGRFQGVKSQLQTVNVNPALSWQINDALSVGAGVNYQHISGELTSAVNYSALAFSAGGAGLLGAIGGPNVEGVSNVSGSDSAWGYNLGALYHLDTQTRVGLAYRSKINYSLSGTVSFSNVPTAIASSPSVANGAIGLVISMPDTFSASVFHQMNAQWDLMADLTWTGWSVLDKLDVVRSNGSMLSHTQENWENTWRIAVGANHHYSEQWTVRTGIAYDQAPVSDTYRTVRIPDANRTWLTLGGQYKPGKESAIDFGYAHLFVSNASINQTVAGAGTLTGNYSNSVDIISAQYTLGF